MMGALERAVSAGACKGSVGEFNGQAETLVQVLASAPIPRV